MTPVLVQQIIILGGASLLLSLTTRFVRRGRLSFGIAVLWSGLAAVALVGAAFVPVVDDVGRVLRVIPAALLAGATSLVLATIIFVLSLRVSALERSLQDIAETSARAAVDPPLGHLSPENAHAATLAIVPAFNERRSIEQVVRGLVSEGLTVLVVDDGSTDGTGDLARDAGASVLRLATNMGVGGALRAGVRHATESGFVQIVQCDGDGQHPVTEVLRLLDLQACSPAHLLIGSRFINHGSRRAEPLVRRVAMSLLSAVATRVARTSITDATSGLRVIRQPLLTEMAKHLPRHYFGDTFEFAVSAGRAGFLIREESVTMGPRLYGRCSASAASAFGLTLRVLLVIALKAHLPLTPPAVSDT